MLGQSNIVRILDCGGLAADIDVLIGGTDFLRPPVKTVT